METLIFYTITFLVVIGILICAIKYHKILLERKSIIIISLLTLFYTSLFFVLKTANEISDKFKVTILVPDGFFSDIQYDSISNPISDEILYNYLDMMRVPHAKIIVAQSILESNNFQSALFKRQNNFFGMKVPRVRISTTGQGKGDYKDYNTWQECATDYIFWMYHHNAHKLSEHEYFKLLGKIYAEDPEYTNKLKNIISKMKY